ncbi:MAG: tetratricopeptide repeat protein [Deltaproteobacteria bacterium]|nr:tetratricopeptide repeat protein [Deltaproteobacteria bacterium]
MSVLLNLTAMTALTALGLMFCIVDPAAVEAKPADQAYRGENALYAGSKSCIECHGKFYKLWSTSWHGLAMQPYTPEFARANLTPQPKDLTIGKYRYRADTGPKAGWVMETDSKGKKKKYPILHALGGKKVYYFLTPLERGRLQTLPVAYDVRTRLWFDTAASGVRHFGSGPPEEPINWKEWPYTFNTACFNCHVSQLSTNYDLQTDTYRTTWAEAGINCETCHGPSKEHNEVMKGAPPGQPPPDLKIISVKKFTHEQHNAACGACHAKASPLTTSFPPGERFFDHFDLVTLENPDYYPDGRDLGENYTFTTWLMSPCVKSGKLDCIKCHTSSGRYRFKDQAKANEACLPCHAERVAKAAEHIHHPADKPGVPTKCVSCHMPMTAFARMNRSDHSMLPPAPAATMKFGSPNACNSCHKDKDATWADQNVRQWRTRDYQAPLLQRAGLIDAARKRDWQKLPEMLTYITSPARDEIFAASLIRLTMAAPDERVRQILLKAIQDPSPLVRAAAAEALSVRPSQESFQALVTATGDSYRLVRVRAAASLAQYPEARFKGEDFKMVKKASQEYLSSLTARPDQWSSHYNLGNYYLHRGEIKQALAAYDTALKIEPRAAMVLVNAAMAYAQIGEKDRAEKSLVKANKIAPENAAAHFNLGLLKAEQDRGKEAERELREAFRLDPKMAQAAYNLCILTVKDRPEEALSWCRKAAELNPQEPKYAYTLAFYQKEQGDLKGAVATLQDLITQRPGFADGYILLAEIYLQQGERSQAEIVMRQALEVESLSSQDRSRVAAALQKLEKAGLKRRQTGK